MQATSKMSATTIVSAALLVSNAAIADVEVAFSPGGGVKEQILAEIEAATTSIDIAMYSFSDAGILKAVTEAGERGLKVRLILDKAPSHAEKAAAFEEAGVDVRYVTPVMHHKFAIFDGPQVVGDDPAAATLLTGSGNWSTSSATNYDEDFLRFTNEEALTVAYQNEFNHLWAYSLDSGDSLLGDTASWEPVPAPVVFTSSNMEAYFRNGRPTFKPLVEAEEGVAGLTIIAAIDAAQTSVQIATTHFRRPDIYKALARALERGVQVDMVLDGQEFNASASGDSDMVYDERLSEKGATVRYKMYARYWDARTAKQMHSKYMIVDGTTVLTGSLNWSFNAELKTMENLLTLQGVEGPYLENFEKVSGYGEGQLEDLIGQIEAQSGKGPCAFPPISLTVEEVKELRGAYAQGACK